MDLRGYEQAKFELSDILQAVAAAKAVEKQRSLQDRLQDLLARLAEDRFNLVVAGRFSRGKSSLMNAILGMDRIPTGIVPLTSVITTVSYGSAERLTIKYRESRLDTQVSIGDLSKYVTQHGNPGNQRGIATANIELPAEILRRGFFFVDTPGLGSVITENTATTRAFLPEIDALLLVTSFESPLSEEELGFLAIASKIKLPAFIAVNKQDLVSATERDEAIDFVRSHLDELHGLQQQGVFAVSARDGLAAKLANDAARLRASGVPALEERLTRFLLEQKRQVFLLRMATRVIDLLDDLPPFEGAPALRRRAQTLSNEYRRAPGADEQSASAPADLAFNRSQLRSCEICAAIEDRTWDFLARYQYQLSTDRECQADFARRSGFCSYHTAEYEGAASSFGTCSGYPPLLERLAALFRNAAKDHVADPLSLITGSLPTHRKCLLCEQRDKAEMSAVSDLAERLASSTTATLEKLSALCLPHLAAIATSLNDTEIILSLLHRQAAVLERTAEDMRRFTLKQSAARRHLQTKEEQAAAQRGLLLLVGRRTANFAVAQGAASSLKIRCCAVEHNQRDQA